MEIMEEDVKSKDFENRTVTDVNGRTYNLRVKLVNRKNYSAVLALEHASDYMDIINREGFDAGVFERAVNDAGIQISSSCPPIDALTVGDIQGVPDKELISRINKVAQCPKKLIYMFAFGYGFRWEEFKIMVESKGFINASESKQKPVYVLPNGQNVKEEKLTANQLVKTANPQKQTAIRKIEIHSYDLMDKEYPHEIRNMLSGKARQNLDRLTKGLSKKESRRVVAELLEIQISELLRMKDAGELLIFGIKTEKIRKEHKI